MPGQRFYPLDVHIRGIDRITGPLLRINAAISRVTKPIRAVSNQVASLSATAGVERLSTAFDGVRTSIGNVGQAAQTAFRRVSYVTAAAGGLLAIFKNQFVDPAADFQQLGLSLTAIEGSAERARTAMGFIKQLTIKTPFEMPEISDAFRLLRAQWMDPMNGTLQAIVDQVAKVGGSGEKLMGISMQLSQAWSKGRLMAQDANILAENGIAVWGLLERAVARVKGLKIKDGDLIPKLRAASEQGALGRKWIAELVKQMGMEAEGAGERAVTLTFKGMVSNIADAWRFFKLRIMKTDELGNAIAGGPWDVITKKIRSVVDAINAMTANGQLDALADRFGARLMAVFSWLDQTIPKAWALLQQLGGWVAWVADLCGGWGNLLKIGLAVFIAGPLMVAIAGLIGAIVALGAALTLTPIGWFLGALALMAVGAGLLVTKWGAVSAFFTDLFGGLQALFGGCIDFIGGLFTLDLTRAISGIKALFKGLGHVIMTALRPVLWLYEKTIGIGTSIGSFGHDMLSGPSVVDRPTLGADRFRSAVANRQSMLASHTRSDARVQIDVAGPRGTRARVQPGSTADVDLRTRIQMGPAMVEAH